MPVVNPIQTGFHGGELSPKMGGRLDLDLYKVALAYCKNWVPTPYGSLLLRAGTKDGGAGSETTPIRTVPFRVSGSSDDYSLVFSDGKMQVFSHATGQYVTMVKNLITNGHFDSDMTGWSVFVGAVFYNETAYLPPGGGGIYGRIYQEVTTTIGQTYTVSFRCKSAATTAGGVYCAIRPGGGGAVVQDKGSDVSPKWRTVTFTFVAANSTSRVEIINNTVPVAASDVWIDDVVVKNTNDTVSSLTAPWTAAQLVDIQWDGELVKNRVVIVHGNVQPQVVQYNSSDCWEIYPATFTSQPGEWGGDNWPSIIEVGYQGRMWLGSTPNEPHTVWYSKSGKAFNFTTGSNADDASSFIVSTKGKLNWMRGQASLLLGSEVVEHAAVGSSGSVIAPGAVSVTDESAHGSYQTQPMHLGEEVLFVGRDRRTLRTMFYDGQVKKGWLTRAISFHAEHLLSVGVVQTAFLNRPFPIVFARLTDNSVVAAVYDRTEKIIAWFRVNVGVDVNDISTAETDDGGLLVMLTDRSPGARLEVLPFHETSVQYLDCWSTHTASVLGLIIGLDQFNGQTVSLIDSIGVVSTFGPVSGGTISGLNPSEAYTVGVPFDALARTLSLEGGNPGGTSQGLAVHYSDIVARLNNSARPKLNGERVTSGKPFTTTAAELDTMFTGDYRVAGQQVSDGGQVEITQDLPYRTEVVALFGQVEVSKI